jgi:hypothetical protein
MHERFIKQGFQCTQLWSVKTVIREKPQHTIQLTVGNLLNVAFGYRAGKIISALMSQQCGH